MSSYNIPYKSHEMMVGSQFDNAPGLAQGRRGEGQASVANGARSVAPGPDIPLDDEPTLGIVEGNLLPVRQNGQVHGYDLNSTSPMDIADRPDEENPTVEDELMSNLKALSLDKEPSPWDSVSASAPASTPVPARPFISSRPPMRSRPPTPSDFRPCTGCNIDIPFYEVSRCPCWHEYCSTCMVNLVTAALADEAIFPASCCGQPISLSINSRFLPPKLMEDYQEKVVEYMVPNKTYCCNMRCSAFIPLKAIQGNVGTCDRCQAQTCVLCKAAVHEGECPVDVETEEFLRFAAENGWRRCHACRRMVAVDTGCSHINCLCGAAFCYACGSPGKKCKCPQWDDEDPDGFLQISKFLNPDGVKLGGKKKRSSRRIDHAPRHLQRRTLFDRRRCAHPNLVFRHGRHRCEDCWMMVRQDMIECERCFLLLCRQCMTDRVE